MSRGAVWAALAVAALSAAAAAQPASSVAADADAGEATLWLAISAPGETLIFNRRQTGGFGAPQRFRGKLVQLCAGETDAFAFFQDGEIYRVAAGGGPPATAHTLPNRRLPTAAVALGGELYAVVPRGLAENLTAADAEPRRTATAAATAYAVVAYDGRAWRRVADCPAAMHAADGAVPMVRLATAPGELILLWSLPGSGEVRYQRLDVASASWRAGGAIELEGLQDFWVTRVARQPTLVTIRAASEQSQALSVYRVLGELRPDRPWEWRTAAIELSALPAGVQPASYHGAFGFNQHLGVVCHDAQGRAYVQFARFDGAAAEPTIDTTRVVSGADESLQLQNLVQLATVVLVVLVVSLLFTFRRGAMINAIKLPAGMATAFTFQRLGGFIVDFGPISIVMAFLLDVGWRDSLGRLSEWVLNPNWNEVGGVNGRVLVWWALSCGTYAVYAFLFEVFLRRTPGKMLLGTRVIADTGAAPAVWQVALRSVMRIVELLPQFWLLGFLIVLSRNRQRLGDIFARTIVVRTAGPDESRPTDDEPGEI